MRAVVCLKQVIDPLTPATSLALDAQDKKIRASAASPPRLRETIKDLEIVCVAAGDRFNADVMKRALAVGADQLVLVQDPSLDTWNSYPIAAALAAAIRQIGGADLILCGRQGSDWDNGLVPYILAELLAMPLLTLARRVSVTDGTRVEIERVLADGSMTMQAALPAVVTVTSELGPLRLPSVAARLSAARKKPRQIALAELGVAAAPAPAPEVVDLAIPLTGRHCTFIEAADGTPAGARLAETLLQAGTVRLGGER
jgi:electron transfer flavoprotein beta subunit